MESKVWLYMNIFWEDPWNEGYICPQTKALYALSSNQESCTCCSPAVKTNLFYDRDELKTIFSILQQKRWYQEQICIWSDGLPIWFIWWWRSNIEDVNREKLRLDEDELNTLIESISQQCPIFCLDDFYYFAEIGVENFNRWTDIAGMLYRSQIHAVLSNGSGDILVRTTKKTEKPYKWFLRMGYIPVFAYNDQQDRVVLIKQYSSYENNRDNA